MNVPADIAHKVVESMKATPFLLGLVMLNTIVLGGFCFTLLQVNAAAERRDAIRDKIIERCIK